MKFKVVVSCNGVEEVLPEGEFEFVLCSLLWSDMCNVAINIELKHPDAIIWSKCLVNGGRFYAKFIISGTDYDSKTAKRAAKEIAVLLADTAMATLVEVN